MSAKNKKILIYGTGAVGGYYGGMLAKNGYDVTFIARGENYIALKNNGLTLTREKDSDILNINVHDSTDSLGIFDYIFICVKSMGTKDALEAIEGNVGKNTTIVSFQNGVDNEELIVEKFGKEKAIGALVFVASKITEPGKIYQFGYNGALIGELDCKKSERIQEIHEMFEDSEINCPISEDINGDLWNKLVWNASFNPISVIEEKTIDQILGDEKLYKLIESIMIEVRDVAIALGYNIRPDTVEFNLNRSKGFTGFKTSMFQDYEKGKTLEVEALVGVVIRKAKEVNLPVPNTEKAYNAVKEKVAVSSK